MIGHDREPRESWFWLVACIHAESTWPQYRRNAGYLRDRATRVVAVMIGQARREQIRRTHSPVGKGGVCAACGETYRCAAIQLLDEVEDVEKRARIALDRYRQERAQQIIELRMQISELEAKIDRARRDLT